MSDVLVYKSHRLHNLDGKLIHQGIDDYVRYSDYATLQAQYRTAISSWDEERKRAEREGLRVTALQARLDTAHAREDALAEFLQQMLDVAENADETGYITDVGFVDIDKLHAQIREGILTLHAAAKEQRNKQ